jgi:hypothetical protein
MKQYGKELTEAGRNAIQQSLSTAFIKCIETLRAANNAQAEAKVKLLDDNRKAVCAEWLKQHPYVTFRIKMFPIYWDIMATDMFVRTKSLSFMHTNEFLHMIIQAANGVTDLLMAHYEDEQHPTYAGKFQQTSPEKAAGDANAQHDTRHHEYCHQVRTGSCCS